MCQSKHQPPRLVGGGVVMAGTCLGFSARGKAWGDLKIYIISNDMINYAYDLFTYNRALLP